jgi:ketosteroid isomerase-like protein
MSQENTPQGRREQFEALLDALNARDFDSLTAFLDPEVEFRSVLAVAEGGPAYTGTDGLRKWADNVDSIWADWHQEVVDFREVSDDQAVAVTRATGRAKASGVPLDTCTGNVLTWRHGKGLRLAAYSDPRDAFDAAGARRSGCPPYARAG